MKRTRGIPVLAATLALSLASAAGCDDEKSVGTADAGRDAPTGVGGADGSTTDRPGTDVPTGDASPQTLYARLGSEAGIRTVMTDFVVNRVLKDPKINGFFLNSTVNGGKVIDCLVLQVGSLTGGPQTYPSMGCRNMKDSHRGLKISMQDFNDLAGHLVDALKAATVATTDIDTIVGAVAPMADDIVEDKASNGTVYQRVGRKPAIDAVVGKLITRVVGDARINGFFGSANAMRLKTCLVRQVCSIDGPCKYGSEVDNAEPGVSATNVCKDMKTSHLGLTSPPGAGAGSRTIAIADFGALVEDLVAELDAAGVSAADKNAILGALGPTCEDIVASGAGCPGRTVVALTTTGALVTFDSKTPSTVSTPVAITGLGAGETVVGLSFRPVGGRLYALATPGRLYEVNRTTGAATAVGPGPLTPALAGTNFGFDFNPTVDRVRVVSDTQQNMRLHPDMGTVVDADAATAGVQGDPLLNPAGLVSAVAYTNSVVGSTVTTLYGIDTGTDALVRIGGPDGMPSPNAGVITRIGELGADTAAPAGFDIAPGSNVALAVLQVGGVSQLRSVALTTGTTTLIGPIGGGVTVRAIAIVP